MMEKGRSSSTTDQIILNESTWKDALHRYMDDGTNINEIDWPVVGKLLIVHLGPRDNKTPAPNAAKPK